MCGIAGMLARDPRPRDAMALTVAGMIHAIRHRGPDGTGAWQDDRGVVGLAHARLTIIDLTSGGNQPMVSHGGGLTLTFNGEIYNYVELKQELAAQEVAFRSTSDSEVLLTAIERWGIERALERARGMFALAVWDAARNALWLARDRAGKKPLYYYRDAQAFFFASEIKGLLAVPGAPRSISRQALADYLSLGFVTGPDTIYREIAELPPGRLMRVDAATLREELRRFWRFPARAATRASPEELHAETARRLTDAVRLRLRADVPVGVFLSGGIDSGLITGIASSLSAKPLQSFTVSFGASAFDESVPARKVAERYGTEHHEIRLEPDLDTLLQKVVRAYDEPLADPSALPTFAISAEAAKYVKVVLNGEGSDELFGGYRRHHAMRALERFLPVVRRLPGGSLARIAGWLPRPGGFRTPYSFFHRVLRAAQADPEVRYLLWGTDGFEESEKTGLFGPMAGAPFEPTAQVLRERWREFSSLPPTAQFMALDFVVGMADCLLPKIDIASMAHGLEGRSPFLDHVLVEWAAQVHKSDLLAGSDTKPVLRALARQYLPPEVAAAPKRGFEIPLVRWMTVDLRDAVRDVCTRERSILFDLFDRAAVLALLDRRVPLDDERWAKRVWILFMLANWGLYVHEDRVRRT